MKLNKLLCGALFAVLSTSGGSFADDTELYLVNTKTFTTRNPKILIIFDNSNSMSTIEEGSPGAYTPDWAPDGFDYSGFINEKAIYWNRGGLDNTNSAPTPLEPNQARRFNVASNGCNDSLAILAAHGRYTGYIREFRKRAWEEVADNNGLNDNKFDCLADIKNGDLKNAPGVADGFPLDSTKMYGPNVTPTDFGKGQPITLYTSDYLIWYQWVTGAVKNNVPPTTVDSSRLATAKAALTGALSALGSTVDVGLAVFNLNADTEGKRDGGRIVSGIKEMTDTNEAALFTLIDGLSAETNTPLCETLYEAHQYFSGGAVTYGDKDTATTGNEEPKSYVPNRPPQDLGIQVNKVYKTPFLTCPEMAYVIYMTDGLPTLDASANTKIAALATAAKNRDANYTPVDVIDKNGVSQGLSYLPVLTSYMFNNDLVKGNLDASGQDNQQSVRTFTIAFSDSAKEAEDLLKEAARRGGSLEGGGYYTADTELDLTGVFDDILKTILSIDSSYTSPSIASNNFDKTQTFNSAYYAMFLPGRGPRWSGNLKKLKVTGDGVLVKPGKLSPAVDANGNISASTCTFWSKCTSGADGNRVNEGGVAEALRMALKSRNIKTNSGTSLVDIDTVNQASLALSMGFGTDTSKVTAHLDWLYGVDVDDDDADGNTTEARVDIMGDPLHSKPLALNFGASIDSPDVRIILGTNQGLVHMFKDSDKGSTDYESGTVEESWAFLPSELMANLKTLKENLPTGEHNVYGMDSSPVSYTEADSAGKLTKAWVFIGMRRGGHSYYALDVSSPDSPSLMWIIKPEGVFADLGQTWSKPVVTKVPGHDGPVLIFGGGYDVASAKGRAVYVVDAAEGTLIKKFAHDDMQSFASSVAVLDSNNDGESDRIYAADIGGNVWRMDMPDDSTDTWTEFKFASLGGSGTGERHFFVEPTVAQTTFTNITKVDTTVDGVTTSVVASQNVPYDAVTLGTGNRPNPLSTNTEDMFFVLQDRNVVSNGASAETLTLAKLYNVTSAAPVTETDNLTFGEMRGWYYDFAGAGEKSLSASLIFDGKVYFTSFAPPSTGTIDLEKGICGTSGKGRLYELDLHKGTRTYSQLYYDLGERVPDTPQIVVPAPESSSDESSVYIIGIGKGECVEGECKGTIKIGTGLTANKIYYHINE
jgi:type IV pilus assembly protein PilY1